MSADYHDEFGQVPTGLTEDRYIKAVEVKEVRLPEVSEKTGGFGTFTIHHMAQNCGEWVATTGAQFDLPLEERNGFRLTYELGRNATIYPADTGVVLEAGCELNFSVHLYASGGTDFGASQRGLHGPFQGVPAEVHAVGVHHSGWASSLVRAPLHSTGHASFSTWGCAPNPRRPLAGTTA